MSDLIDRQQAIDAIAQCTNCGDEDTLREYVLKHSLDNGWTGGVLEALDAVKNLPPAQPEPHEGHWIGSDGSYICSECNGSPLDFIDTMGASFDAYVETPMKFCPNCGAKMKGVEHETD